MRSGRAAGWLAEACGLDPDALEWHSAIHDPARRHVVLCGERLRRRDWDRDGRRWCSVCLAQDAETATGLGLDAGWVASHRSWWDVVPILSCPLHEVLLQTTCPSCGAGQGWDRPPLHRCRCGALLASTGGEIADVGLIDRFLHGRLTGGAVPDLGPFADLPLYETLPLLRWIGRVALDPWEGRWPAVGASLDRGRLEEGARLASLWPGAFVDALDRGLAARSSTRRPGMIGAYGWVHEQFASRLGDGAADVAIRTVLRDHAVDNGIVASGEAILAFAACPGTIGMGEARSLLRVGAPVARRLLGRAGRLPSGSRRSVRHALDRRDVLSIAERDRACVGLVALGRRLGLGRRATRAVVATGLLADATVAVEAGAPPRFDEARVAVAISRLARRKSGPSRKAEITSLAEAARIAGVDVATILERVRTGELVPASWPGDGMLAAATFRKADLARAPRPSTLDGLTATAARLRLHPEALRGLVELGWIEGVRGASGWRFDETSIETFERNLVPATELARMRGTTSTGVVRLLARQGVSPVAAPPACRQVVYRRADLAVLAYASPRAPVERSPRRTASGPVPGSEDRYLPVARARRRQESRR